MAVTINVEETPNPNARRYILDQPVQEQSKGRYFKAGDEADDPLAKSLLAVEGTDSVMLLPKSVTVNKRNDQTWDLVDPAARKAIENHFSG